MTDKVTPYKREFGIDYRVPLIWSAAVALAGCAGATPPVDAVSTAEMAVNRAIDARAAQHAPLQLRLAQEKLERAKASLNEEDYEAARRQAEQAGADARLAEAKARSQSASQHGEEVEQTIEILERESDRNTPKPTTTTVPVIN